jgi:ABC-type glycerol-3-phosphate transport system substrate-binding protein
MRWFSILVLALALVAAGCGGGDDDSSASGDTTVEETTTDTTTTDTTTTDDGTGTTGEFDFADEDCQALLGVGATIAAAFSATGGGDADTEELSELAGKVPDEIQADVQTLADAFGEYAAKLQDIGIEAGATPSPEQVQELQAAIASLDQQELTAASQRVQAWATENCTG